MFSGNLVKYHKINDPLFRALEKQSSQKEQMQNSRLERTGKAN